MDSYFTISTILVIYSLTYASVISIEVEKCKGIRWNTTGTVNCLQNKHISAEKVWLGNDSCRGPSVKVLTNLISHCTNTSYCQVPFYSRYSMYRNMYLNVQFQCKDKETTCLPLSSGISKPISCGKGRKIVIDEAWIDQTECPLRIPSGDKAGGNITSNISSICSKRESCSLLYHGISPLTANVYFHCIDVTLSSTTPVQPRYASTSTTHFTETVSKDNDLGSTADVRKTIKLTLSTSATGTFEINSDITNTATTSNSSAVKYVYTSPISSTTSSVLQQSTNCNNSKAGSIVGGVFGFLFLCVLVVCVIIVKRRKDKSSNASDNTNIVTKYEPNYCEPWDIKSKNNNDNVQDCKPITFIDDGIFSSKCKTTSPSNGNEYSTIELDYDHLEKVEYETDTNDNTEDNVYSHLREVNVESDKYDHIVRQSSSIRRNIDGNYSFTFRNRSNDGYDMCNISFSLKKDNQDDLNC